jgi:(1->4)-alpha-D-glucan 1-alpha-D-glucosylmutase
VIARALCFRRSRSELFTHGEYIPVTVTGKRKDHVFAFARQWQDRWAVVVTPRLTATLTQRDHFPTGDIWQNTSVLLPKTAPAKWRSLFEPGTERSISENSRALKLSSVLGKFPMGLLESATEEGGKG